jgi:hypothetical protein
MKRRDALLALLLFFLVFGVYATSQVTQSMDSRWSIHLARSIIKERNLDLDEYQQIISPGDYKTEWVNGHLYSFFPIGNSVLAVPFLYICDVVDPGCLSDAEAIHLRAELYLGSFLSALAVVIVYFIGRSTLGAAKSIVLALVFAFCTSAWSIASRSLWEVGTSMFLLSVTLLILLAARRRPWLVQFAGIPLSYSFFVRPTNSISIVLLTVYVFLEYRRFMPGYLFGALLVAMPFVWVNLQTYGSPFTPYDAPNRVGATQNLLDALAGHLFSPSRGLFIFSPVLLLAVVGVFLKARGSGLERLDYLLLLVIGLHWAVISTNFLWWGGWTFGPRQFTDMLPYLVLFLIPVVDLSVGARLGPLPVAFGVLVAVSMFIHYRGATNPATFEWNFVPVNLDLQPSRVWDWQDPQFLRAFPPFDRLVPGMLDVSPSTVVVHQQPAEDVPQHIPVSVHLSRGMPFDWMAQVISAGPREPGEVGADVTFLPARGDDVLAANIDVTILARGAITETRHLGEIRISARPSGGSSAAQSAQAGWQSVVVPIDVLPPFSERVYLPSVSSASH